MQSIAKKIELLVKMQQKYIKLYELKHKIEKVNISSITNFWDVKMLMVAEMVAIVNFTSN